MSAGLKLTKAAILALLKKKRKTGQLLEAGANRKKGTLERAHLKRDGDVRRMQGTGNKPQKPSDKEKQGGKLSDYKGKNKVYEEVSALRKAKAEYIRLYKKTNK